MSFIARYVYTNEEFVFVTEASTVQQNDRTINTDNKKKKKKNRASKSGITIYKLTIVCTGILCAN